METKFIFDPDLGGHCAKQGNNPETARDNSVFCLEVPPIHEVDVAAVIDEDSIGLAPPIILRYALLRRHLLTTHLSRAVNLAFANDFQWACRSVGFVDRVLAERVYDTLQQAQDARTEWRVRVERQGNTLIDPLDEDTVKAMVKRGKVTFWHYRSNGQKLDCLFPYALAGASCDDCGINTDDPTAVEGWTCDNCAAVTA